MSSKKMSNKKIFISGASGMGKTTLAQYLSIAQKIPFINSSTKELWPKYGIRNHSDLINKTERDVGFGIEFQWEVLNLRKEKTKGLDSFVTDRGPLDNMVYFTTQLAHKVDEKIFGDYIKRCSENLPKEHFYQINLRLNPNTFKKQNLEADGFRIHNLYYQNYIDGVFRDVLNRDWLGLQSKNCDIINIDEWDWRYRVELLEFLLNR